MKIKKLFQVLVLGGTTLGLGVAACGGTATGATPAEPAADASRRRADAAVPEGRRPGLVDTHSPARRPGVGSAARSRDRCLAALRIALPPDVAGGGARGPGGAGGAGLTGRDAPRQPLRGHPPRDGRRRCRAPETRLLEYAPLELTPEQRLTYEVVAQSCVSETESMATLVTSARRGATTRSLKSVLHELARDEVAARPARLGLPDLGPRPDGPGVPRPLLPGMAARHRGSGHLPPCPARDGRSDAASTRAWCRTPSGSASTWRRSSRWSSPGSTSTGSTPGPSAPVDGPAARGAHASTPSAPGAQRASPHGSTRSRSLVLLIGAPAPRRRDDAHRRAHRGVPRPGARAGSAWTARPTSSASRTTGRR